MRTRQTNVSGFSFVEVVLALGIFATIGVALIGLLGTGIGISKDALADAEVAMLVENIQARLTLDPAWPSPAGSSDGKSATLFFDNSGAAVKTEAVATFRATLTSFEGPGFKSSYFDSFRVSVERLPRRQAIGVWQLQRARLALGQPSAAP